MPDELNPWVAATVALLLILVVVVLFVAVLLRRAQFRTVNLGIPFLKVTLEMRLRAELELSNSIEFEVTKVTPLEFKHVESKLWGYHDPNARVWITVADKLAARDRKVKDALTTLRKALPDEFRFTEATRGGSGTVGIQQLSLTGRLAIHNRGNAPDTLCLEEQEVHINNQACWKIRVRFGERELKVPKTDMTSVTVTLDISLDGNQQGREGDLDVLVAGQELYEAVRSAKQLDGIRFEWRTLGGKPQNHTFTECTVRDHHNRITESNDLDAVVLREKWLDVCSAVGLELQRLA